MRIDVHLYIEPNSEVLARLDALAKTLGLIMKNEAKIMATLDDVLAEVTDESSRLDSIQALIDGIKQQLADALSGASLPPGVQAKVDAVFTALGTNKGKLDVALNANVPPATP